MNLDWNRIYLFRYYLSWPVPWSVEETKAQEHVQSQLDRVHRNRDIYERVTMELEDSGYIKTWKQCRTKIKNLTQKYRKVCI